MIAAFRHFPSPDRSSARIGSAYIFAAAFVVSLFTPSAMPIPARAGEGTPQTPMVSAPTTGASTSDAKLPRKRKKTTGIIDVCEMEWVGGAGSGTVECVTGSSKNCTTCSMHDASGVIPQPALLPNGPARNQFWCGCP
jgi:hypothetical protein